MGPAWGHRAGEPQLAGIGARGSHSSLAGPPSLPPGPLQTAALPFPEATPAPALTDSLGGGPGLRDSPELVSDLQGSTLFFHPYIPSPAPPPGHFLPFDSAVRKKAGVLMILRRKPLKDCPARPLPPRLGDSQGKQTGSKGTGHGHKLCLVLGSAGPAQHPGSSDKAEMEPRA